MQFKVKIIDYGFSESLKMYYVTYKVTGLNNEELRKMGGLLEDPVTVKENELYMNVYFEEEYFPFGTGDSKNRLEDYMAREELEMTAYLFDLMDD